ncbi:UNVERIFIED_CONTAM: hypothetical protein FKN15_020890 [Acipenser sinensis]
MSNLGLRLDSLMMRAYLSNDRVAAILNCLALFQQGSTVKLVSKTIESDGRSFISHPTWVTPHAPDPSVAQCLRLHPKHVRRHRLTVSRLSWKALRWWRQASHLSKGVRME